MWDHLRRTAAASLRGFTRLTGLIVNRDLAQLVAEDTRARVLHFARRDARRREWDQATRLGTSDDCFDFSQAHFGVGPVQHRSEITALVKLAEENDARVACEIGAFDAGTSIVFSRALPLETLIVMDLYVRNRWRLRNAAPQGQTVHIIDGDSSHPLTVARLQHKLHGQQLDLLLIDGNHSWAGVRQDFLAYHKLVRDGGLIAFHDICGVTDPTSDAFAGDVPAFWQLLSSIYTTHEFIASPDQQGLGIGVVRFDASRSTTPILNAMTPRTS